MNLNLSIRRATPADVSAAYAIDAEAFGSYGTAESFATLAARQAIFPAGFIMAEDVGVVGYGSSEKWLTERVPALDEPPRLTHHPEGRIFCITAMAVRRSRQNQGVGTALLNAFLEIARSHHCQAVLLETTHAQDFYRHRSFQVAQLRQERGVALAVMRLRL